MSDHLFVHRDSPEDNPNTPFEFNSENQKVRKLFWLKNFLKFVFLILLANQGDPQHLPRRSQARRDDSTAGPRSASTRLASHRCDAQSRRDLGVAQHASLRSRNLLHDVLAPADWNLPHPGVHHHALLAARIRRNSRCLQAKVGNRSRRDHEGHEVHHLRG